MERRGLAGGRWGARRSREATNGGLVMDDDKFHDECGVFGIYGHPEAPALTRLGL